MVENIEKEKIPNPRGAVIRANIFTVFFTIISIVAFIPIAIITAYFIFSYLGKEETLLGLFESWNIQGFSNFFIDKINASSQKDIYQPYFLFAVLSFIISFIILITSIKNASRERFNKRKKKKHLKKKSKKLINIEGRNFLLCLIHSLGLLAVFTVYYIFFNPDIFKNIETTDDIIKFVWTVIIPFLVIVLHFMIAFWNGIKNENNIDARKAQKRANLLKRSSKAPLNLFAPYWGYFLCYLLELYVFVFCTDETLTTLLNVLFKFIEIWITGHLFKPDVLKLESKLWQSFTEDLEYTVREKDKTLAIIDKSLEDEIAHSDYLEETIDSKNEVINAQQEYIYALEDELYSYTQK